MNERNINMQLTEEQVTALKIIYERLKFINSCWADPEILAQSKLDEDELDEMEIYLIGDIQTTLRSIFDETKEIT